MPLSLTLSIRLKGLPLAETDTREHYRGTQDLVKSREHRRKFE